MTQKKVLILLDIDDVLFDTAHFKISKLTEYRLFDDVLLTLDSLGKIATIGILSQGEHAFQLKKLLETGIHERFIKEHVHIVDKKDESLGSVLKKYKKNDSILYFVDDRLSGLYYAKQALVGLKTIWLKRGRYATTQGAIREFIPDFTVTGFGEILEIVKQ